MVQHQRKSRCEWDHDQGPYRTASKIRGLMDGTGTGILYFQRDGTIRLSTMNNYADNLRRMQSICTKQDKTTQPLAQEVAQWRSKRQHKAKNRRHSVLVWVVYSVKPLKFTTNAGETTMANNYALRQVRPI